MQTNIWAEGEADAKQKIRDKIQFDNIVVNLNKEQIDTNSIPDCMKNIFGEFDKENK